VQPSTARAIIRHCPKAGDAERLLTAAPSAQEGAQLAQAQTDTATALVSVYRSLGGGWAAPVAQ